MDYNQAELLTCAASRILTDNSTVIVGTGRPLLAAMLAQRTHAPNLIAIFEAGGVGASPPELPISVGERGTYYKGVGAGSMHRVMSAGQAGFVEYGFLGGAQIDKYGNLNSTVIGDWSEPSVRFPGSGGANDIGSWAWNTIISINQSKKTFVDELDFLTTPGYLSGPGSREEAGLPKNTGPHRVITQLGIYEFDDETKRMKLKSIHPGVDESEIQENSQFEILIPDDVETTSEPTEEELEIIREIDTQGMIV